MRNHYLFILVFVLAMGVVLPGCSKLPYPGPEGTGQGYQGRIPDPIPGPKMSFVVSCGATSGHSDQVGCFLGKESSGSITKLQDSDASDLSNWEIKGYSKGKALDLEPQPSEDSKWHIAFQVPSDVTIDNFIITLKNDKTYQVPGPFKITGIDALSDGTDVSWEIPENAQFDYVISAMYQQSCNGFTFYASQTNHLFLQGFPSTGLYACVWAETKDQQGFPEGRFLALNSPYTAPQAQKVTLDVTNVPVGHSRLATLEVQVGGENISHYRYALLDDYEGCQQAEYSDWISVDTLVKDNLGEDGFKTFCVLAKSTFGSSQSLPRNYTWYKDTVTPPIFDLNMDGMDQLIDEGGDLIVNWAEPDDVHLTYEVLLSQDANCKEIQTMGVTQNSVYKFSGLSAGSYYVCVFAIDQAGNRTQASEIVEISVVRQECPVGYVMVPGDPTPGLGIVDEKILAEPWSEAYQNHSGSKDFCVMKYEAKIKGSNYGNQPYDPSFAVESRMTGTPWVNIDRNQAIEHCQSLGQGYDLITNSQWQAIARNSEKTAINWSEEDLASSTAQINRGHSDGSPGVLLEASTDDNPCYLTEQDYCEDKSYFSNNKRHFFQKRTHSLSNGHVIWDFGGNAWEWVKNDNTRGGTNDYVYLFSGKLKLMWGPSGTYSGFGSSLGYGYLDYSSSSFSSATVVRGGGHWNSNYSSKGLFSVILFASLAPNPNVGFRCVRAAQP